MPKAVKCGTPNRMLGSTMWFPMSNRALDLQSASPVTVQTFQSVFVNKRKIHNRREDRVCELENALRRWKAGCQFHFEGTWDVRHGCRRTDVET